jgi:TetR/AcrR family transcriptional regulator, repressor for neighboring sulfatase
MAAVLEATVELLAEAGPRTLSVRQVAERAGVNHALVHRHFGTKDEIVRRALETQSAAVARDVRDRSRDGGLDVVRVLEVLADHPAYWTTLARVVLDDPELAGRGATPTTELFAAAARREGGDPGTTALAACLMLGRQVFGAFVVESTGTTAEDLDTDVSRLLRSLLGG